jgi:hypothetical protein
LDTNHTAHRLKDSHGTIQKSTAVNTAATTTTRIIIIIIIVIVIIIIPNTTS